MSSICYTMMGTYCVLYVVISISPASDYEGWHLEGMIATWRVTHMSVGRSVVEAAKHALHCGPLSRLSRWVLVAAPAGGRGVPTTRRAYTVSCRVGGWRGRVDAVNGISVAWAFDEMPLPLPQSGVVQSCWVRALCVCGAVVFRSGSVNCLSCLLYRGPCVCGLLHDDDGEYDLDVCGVDGRRHCMGHDQLTGWAAKTPDATSCSQWSPRHTIGHWRRILLAVCHGLYLSFSRWCLQCSGLKDAWF